MQKRFRVRFEPVRVVDHADTEGKPAAQYIEASAVADALDKSLDHDKLWKTPAPQASLTMTLHDPDAMKYFGARQPFFVEFVMTAPDEPKPRKAARKKKPATGAAAATATVKKVAAKVGKKTGKSPRKSPARTPRTKVLDRKTAGTSTSATPVKDQPVTNPGGNA